MPAEGPVRAFLRKNFPRFFGDFFGEQLEALPLPEGISRDQAIDVLQSTAWAQNTSEGVVNALGLTGAQREKTKQAWARRLAESQVNGMVAAGRGRKTA